MPAKTAEAEQRIRDLFATWQQRLGLEQWRITIIFEPFEPATSTMQVHKVRDYQHATVKVQPWVTTNTPPAVWMAGIGYITDLDVEETVVHELIHCCIDSLWNWVDMLRPETHADALDTAVRAWDHTEESVVDKLAVALVKAWPK